MPCYQPDPKEERAYERGLAQNASHHPDDLYMIGSLERENKKIEAMLCAVITELEKDGLANEVISQASKSGVINIMDFWERHSKEDETRLAKELHKYSEHEQEVIKKLLNKN